MSDEARLARWRATREGARFACPHCWTGTSEPGRCGHCRRFDVQPVRARRVERLGPPAPASVPQRLASLEQQLGLSRAARRADDRIGRVHEEVGCPKCLAPVGERCRRAVLGGWQCAKGGPLKHAHRERLRAAGISLR